MCKQRELTADSPIVSFNQSSGERSIQALMRKQLTLVALISTVTTTEDTEKRNTACQEIKDIIKELRSMNPGWF